MSFHISAAAGPKTASLIRKKLKKKANIEYRILNHEYRMSKECILSILFVKKSRAKPPARRGFSAYASESDFHHSSIVNRHSMKFHISCLGLFNPER